jgi:capsular polysaccharide biosynthesis protein
VTVADVYQALWRHKIFIVIATVVALACTWFLTSTKPKVYEATTLIRVEQRTQDPGQVLSALETGAQLVRTYARIATTSTIEGNIANQLKGQVPPGEVYGSLSASQVSDLELLNLTASSQNPKVAALIANAAPQALREWIKRTATTRDLVVTVQQAGVPSSPSSPQVKSNLVLALVLGLILNSGLALLADFLLDRVGKLEELEPLVGHPLLSAVPALKLQTASSILSREFLTRDLPSASPRFDARRTEIKPAKPASERTGA